MRDLPRKRALHRPALGALAILIAIASGTALLGTDVASATAPKYLLALGDSLAAGYQPADHATLPPVDAGSGFRDQGYPGSYAADLASSRGLTLADLACPGESTSSMLAKPAQALCGVLYETEFGVGSQISAAQSFLSREKGHVGLVTLDIGANDLNRCDSTVKVNTACLASTDAAAVKNLRKMLTALVSAVHRFDPGTRIEGMNYYDPFLGLEYSPGGTKGAELALGSLVATNAFNAELTATFNKFGLLAVNVASTFRLNSLTPLVRFDGKMLPQDVASTCELTWMCPSAAGQTADIHPNAAGYRTIAGAFEKRLVS